MSRHRPEHFEADALPGWRLAAVSGVVVGIMAAGVVLSVHLDGHGAAQIGPAPAARAQAAIEPGLLSQASAQAWVQAQRARLAGYAWVDRKHGVLAIPIDRAKEIYLRNQR